MTGAVAYKAALRGAAARYVARGWQLFICGNDKKPLQQGGFKNASTDLARLDPVLTRRPDAMLAVCTGLESGIVVIDVDIDTANGIDGREWLVEAQQKGLPACPIVETPRGGQHLYFAHPGEPVRCTAGKLGKSVDVRGDGGYVITAPSRSPRGEYRWVTPTESVEPPPLPQWLLEEVSSGRARIEPDDPPPTANHAKIVDGCAWYRTIVVDGSTTCREPDWFAGASITARCKNGEAAFLAYSRKHPDFNEREAHDKFRRAVKSNAPRTCASIADDLGHRELCAACPHWGAITSPIQLGRLGYDPGDKGPLSLGYTAEGNFVFLDLG